MTDQTDVIAEENAASDENPVEVIEVVDLVEIVDIVDVVEVPEAVVTETAVEESLAGAIVDEVVINEPVAEAVREGSVATEPVAEAAVEKPIAAESFTEAAVEEPTAEQKLSTEQDSAPEEPVANAIVEKMADEDLVVEHEPVAEMAIEEPAVEMGAKEPTAEKPAAEEPVAKQEPVAELTKEAESTEQESAPEEPEPVAEAVIEKMADEGLVVEHEPVAEMAIEEPAVEMGAKEPVAEQKSSDNESTAKQEPVAEQESAAKEPAAEAAVEKPAAEAATTKTSAEKSATKKSAKKGKEQASDDKVVRVLSVGQEVTGKVKRIADFGAFVDIGVGRDGLLHISELSLNRIGKVTDVLKQGQEITCWIKELDRDRNRISLTMISPDTKTIRDLNKDDIVEGTVSRMENYGAFIDIGIGRDALLHVREMASGYIKHPGDVVKIGEKLEARIIEISRRRSRVDLSIKGLRPEPEAAIPPKEETTAEEEIEMVDDPYENVEVLSPMELAFKRAMSDDGDSDDGELTKPKPKKKKSDRRAEKVALQEEIFDRTLKNSRS